MPAAYLKMTGVEGGCEVSGFEGTIEVLSFSHGVMQSGAMQAASEGGRGQGVCSHSDLSIVKLLDRSSPILAQKCSVGDVIKDVTLTICRAKGDNEKLMEYVLSDAIITSVRPGGSMESEGIPLEEVSLAYTKIKWTYTQFEGGNTTGNYNLRTRKAE